MTSQDEFFSQLFGGSDVSDIANFQKTIADNNIFSQLAPQVAAAPFDTSNWSLGQTVGVTAGKAFLSSLLNAIGQRQQSDQLVSLASVLPDLYKNPFSVQAPEGVDPQAFAGLKLNAITRADKSKSAALQSLAKDILGVEVARQESAAKALGELEGKNSFYDIQGSRDPESPLEKKVTDLNDKFSKREEVQNFSYVQRLSDQLAQTMKNPSAVADPVLAKMVVQFVEPKLAVNAGEAAGLAASSSIPDAWKGQIAQAMEGKSKLTPTMRTALLDIAKAAYQAHGSAYSRVYNQFKNEAKLFNIDPARISSIGEPKTFEELTKSSMPSFDIEAAKLEGAKLKAQGFSTEDIAAALRAKYGGLPHG